MKRFLRFLKVLAILFFGGVVISLIGALFLYLTLELLNWNIGTLTIALFFIVCVFIALMVSER